jgi:hypothetical protein
MLDAEQQSISCSATRSCRWLARGNATFFGDLRMRDGHSTSANLFYPKLLVFLNRFNSLQPCYENGFVLQKFLDRKMQVIEKRITHSWAH